MFSLSERPRTSGRMDQLRRWMLAGAVSADTMLADGIVVNRAIAGDLSANKIRAGTIQNPSGTSYWNLEATGTAVELQLGGVTILHNGATSSSATSTPTATRLEACS